MKSLVMLILSLSAFSAFADASKLLPSELIKHHHLECPEFDPKDDSSVSMNTLHGTAAFYILTCERYAYNSLEKGYIIDNYGHINDVSVADVLADGSFVGTSDLMGATFEEKSLTLQTFYKGRGIGDCGSSSTYVYSIKFGKFILTEARVKDTCDEEMDEWPVVYKK